MANQAAKKDKKLKVGSAKHLKAGGSDVAGAPPEGEEGLDSAGLFPGRGERKALNTRYGRGGFRPV